MVVVEVPFDRGVRRGVWRRRGVVRHMQGCVFTVGATCPIVGMRRGLGLAVVANVLDLGAFVDVPDLAGAVRAAMLLRRTLGNSR